MRSNSRRSCKTTSNFGYDEIRKEPCGKIAAHLNTFAFGTDETPGGHFVTHISLTPVEMIWLEWTKKISKI